MNNASYSVKMTTDQLVSFFLSIQLAVLVYLVSLYLGLIKPDKLMEDKTINGPRFFVGIVSSPDHFKERQSLRDTWLKTNPGSFHYRFFIGETCNIHPQYRMSQYNCDYLATSIPNYVKGNNLLNATSVGASNHEGHISNSNGFNFYVHHTIEVHYLGVKTNLNLNDDATLTRVVLLNSTSLFKISSVTFDKSLVQTDVTSNGYIFKKLKNPVVLPRGFEGSVRLEGLDRDDQSSICTKPTVWTHYNLLTTYHPNLNSSLNTCFLSTFSFTIKDLDSLKFYLNNGNLRRAEWLQHTQELAKILQQEADKFKDILFLNVVDVYRNLPKKVLYFLKWVYDNYNVDYVLKTDDDTFIDMSAVMSELESSSGWDLWSCFRVGWPVQRFGRHRESAYLMEVYPTFPSGAGYVLSKNVLTWLVSRINELSTQYQGEDVAMGIWLEKLNLQMHFGEACYWACNEHCHANTCNAMQLSVDEVYSMWKYYNNCGSKICKCPIR